MSLAQGKLPATIFYTLLLLQFFFIVFVLKAYGSAYDYDEVITTQISKQPVHMLLDTVLAEPHPPGFYLLLKSITATTPGNTRIFTTCIGIVVTVLTAAYAYKSPVTKIYKLEYGLLIFFLSPFFLLSLTSIKQDTITTPLFVMAFILGLEAYVYKKPKSLWLLTLTSVIILGFGYINFLKTFFILLLVTIKQKLNIKNLLPLLLCTSIALTFFSMYTHKQLIYNQGRFSWQGDQYDSIGNVLTEALGGYTTVKGTFFLANIISLTLVILAATNLSSNILHQKWAAIGSIAIILLYFCAIGVARNRYVTEIFLIICVLAGWTVQRISIKKDRIVHTMLNIFLILYILNGMSNYLIINKAYLRQGEKQETISKLSKDIPTGIIFRHPTEAFVRKIGYFPENENAIPFSPANPDLDARAVTKELLKEDGKYKNLSHIELYENIRSSGITRFIYGSTDSLDKITYFDPERTTVRLLNDICSVKSFHFTDRDYFIVFDNCTKEYASAN